MGVRGLLVYCSDYHCSRWVAIRGDRWPDDVRFSDLEPSFVCQACGTKGANVRPDFEWIRQPRRGWPSGHNPAASKRRGSPYRSDGGPRRTLR